MAEERARATPGRIYSRHCRKYGHMIVFTVMPISGIRVRAAQVVFSHVRTPPPSSAWYTSSR
ncbi:hypothetical protein DENSPDRAFT_133692 [Dentipellis sp. KUC8613]|nr:hypothetical protein DENSPDRAFT_133692 [Dentipellis sp. KUC8613]